MDQTFAALKRFVRPRVAVERCDLCSIELAAEHPHLFEPKTRQLQCACDACAILFSNQGDGRFSRVPRRSTYLTGFQMTDLQWNSLMLPIQLAFFFYSTTNEKVVALYPSPAGATESLLPLDAWDDIVRANPSLKSMQPDVEALLVNRVRDRREYFIAPIDKCYELVGLIRSKWTGLSGGTEVWREIDKFFSQLKERSYTAASEVANA
jgi:hypothetical protein